LKEIIQKNKFDFLLKNSNVNVVKRLNISIFINKKYHTYKKSYFKIDEFINLISGNKFYRYVKL
jgi:hypothetical protein